MSTTAHYLIHGLRISSEVMLPAAAPYAFDPHATPVVREQRHATGSAETDIRIELLDYQPVGAEPPPGTVILDHHAHGHRQYVAARTGEQVRFRVPGYGDFVLADGHTRVACTPDPRVAPGHLPIMLMGRVLPFLMALAGHTVLRAGAVEVADGAIAVAGTPGTGTSTLTAWLCAAGARLVTDDVLRVDDDGTCHRGSREVLLRDKALSLAIGLEPSDRIVRRTVDGRRAVRPPATPSARLCLHAVVIPRPAPRSRELSVHRLDAASSAMVLADVRHTLGWRVSPPFTTVTNVASQVAVHVVDIPWGPPFDPHVPRQLLDLLGLGPPVRGPGRAGTTITEPART